MKHPSITRTPNLYVGLGLILAGTLLIGANELVTVHHTKAMEEDGGLFVEVRPDVVDPENDGRLVLVRGRIKTPEPLEDPDTGFKAWGLVLERRVRPYSSWRVSFGLAASPAEENPVDDTTGTLAPGDTEQWAGATPGQRASSSQHEAGSEPWPGESAAASPAAPIAADHAPSAFLKRLRGHRWETRQVTLGAFQVPPALVTRLTATRPRPISEPMFKTMAPHLGEHARLFRGAVVVTTSGGNGGALDPVVISYHVAPVDIPVTILAKQVGTTFAPYDTPAGRVIFEVTRGLVPRPGTIVTLRGVPVVWWVRWAALLLMLWGIRRLHMAGPPFRDPASGTKYPLRLLLFGAGVFCLAAGLPWLGFRPGTGSLLGIAGVLAIGVSMTTSRSPAVRAS